MSDSLPLTLTMGLIKSVVCVYDVLSLPIYSMIQRPWSATNASQVVKAKQADPSDPYSPWTRIASPPDHLCYHSSSVAELFSKSCKHYKDMRAFGSREVFGEEDEKQADGKVFKKMILGDYKWFTYQQIDERVDHIARGFMSVGVKPGDVVLILAETRLEWMLSAQAIFRLGATIATLYTTLGQDGILHGISETEVTHIVTTYDIIPLMKAFYAQCLRSGLKHQPKVNTIIFIEGHKTPDLTGFPPNVNLIPFQTIEAKGRASTGLKFTAAQPEDPAVIMYTSGSTGIPKGVIITHRNVMCAIGGFFAVAHSLAQNGTYMAYLPLAHVLELAAETFFVSIGVSVGFSSPHTMTDKSTAIKKGQSGDAVLLKPTVMAAVPLVLDRIRKGVWDQMETRGKFAKAFFQFVVDYKKFWMKRGFKTPIINAVVCSKIRAMLGGEIKQIVCGSAPLSPDTMEFVRVCLDVVVLQGYGLTETTAGSAIMDMTDMSVGRVGPPLHGIKLKLVDWAEGNYFVTDKPYPRGEIVIGGDCVAAGYYKNEDLTSESFREEDGVRWFYTGDIGEMHPDGSLKIIDRKKDLVKLQYGEYISLGKVETELKSCPIVDNICVYGDSYHNYVVAIVVPQPKALRAIAVKLGKEHLSHEKMCRDQLIVAEVMNAIQDHGKRAKLLKTEIPSKVIVAPEEWSPDSGLVTAAMKIRRKNITDHYKRDINRLYGISENGRNGVKST